MEVEIFECWNRFQKKLSLPDQISGGGLLGLVISLNNKKKFFCLNFQVSSLLWGFN